MAVAAYFFLLNQEQAWPPPPFAPPDLLPGTLFTIVILLSEIPNSIAKRAAEHGELRKLRRMLIVVTLVGLVLLGLRGWEFDSLNVLWSDNAYGSTVWALLLLQAVHFVTDWVDTIVLAALMRLGPRRGYFARRQPVPLRLTPLPAEDRGAAMPLAFAVSMGVRRGDKELKSRLERSLERRAPEIERLLASYAVPQVSFAPPPGDED